MPIHLYNWQRFWCPREGSYSLQDGGYLTDPEVQWGKARNPQLVTFDKIADLPCLALLGEPGIGKSRAMLANRDAARARVEADGGQMLWVDLRSCGSEQRVIQKVFECEAFKVWAGGTHRLHLFLDSLDECLLRVDTIAALLLEELSHYCCERLTLRIMCRTADLPNMLEGGLPPLWEQKNLRAYELAPLRRADVVAAAAARSLDSVGFLQEVDRAGAVPLAIKPVTLEFLMNAYARGGQLPASQAELYQKGCRILCEETAEGRLAAHARGALGPDERLATAAWIAAVTQFTNRYAVYTGPDLGDVPEGALPIRELCGGLEDEGAGLAVTERVVREVLATGLFSGRGPGLMGWAHQTYAEYLAARYVAVHRMPLAQTLSLIVHPEDPNRRLVPQLQETAAWLAGQDPAVFRAVMGTDPQALLLSDVATAGAADRAALTLRLLEACEREELSARDLSAQGRLGKLRHLGLTDQLRPYLVDVGRNVGSRWAAIDIAEACDALDLQSELADVALDATQPLLLRVQAAYAVTRIGDSPTKARLLPLARGAAGDDPDDELKGCGLMAVWPEHLTAAELLPLLTTPKTGTFGSYRAFLSRDFGLQFRPEDLPLALAWVGGQEYGQEYEAVALHPFAEPMGGIMEQAWQHLKAAGVLDAFARVALKRIKAHEAVVGVRAADGSLSPPYDDEDKRHDLVDAVVAHVEEAEEAAFGLVSSPTPLVLNSDTPWLLQRLVQAPSERARRLYAKLAHLVFSWQKPDYLDATRAVAADCPPLAREFSHLLEPVRLDSPEAEYQRTVFQREQEWERHRSAPKLVEPPPAARLQGHLDRFEAGDLSAWWHLNLDMTLKPDGRFYGNERSPDLKALPGWGEATVETRARIVCAAQKYLVEQAPKPEAWVGTDTLHRPDFAGYRALVLLAEERSGAVAELTAGTWKKWAAVILAYPAGSSGPEATWHRALVALAYRFAPDEILSTLLVLIDRENERHGTIFILEAAAGCWDGRLAQEIVDKLGDPALRPRALGVLLAGLLDQDGPDLPEQAAEARRMADRLVASASDGGEGNEAGRERAFAAASVLAYHATDAGWPVIWPAVLFNPEFGRRLVESFASEDRRAGRVLSRLADDQLADLYLWLEAQYPHAEDPQHEGVFQVGPRESVADWRNAALSHLQRRGTAQACHAIARLTDELPGHQWLRDVLRRAQDVTRRKSWTPPTPLAVLKLAANGRARLVQSGDHLLQAVAESLERLQQKLQGETPAAPFLWDKVAEGAWRPKDENSLSDFVKIHLTEDLKGRGVVANREVEIRRGQGRTPGEATDIHVDAAVPGAHAGVLDVVSVIVETKGCWHRELETAMRTQLVERYMRDNTCRHGLYLVGWFNCPQWDDRDPRLRQAVRHSRGDLEATLRDQAKQLAGPEVHITSMLLDTSLR